MKLRWKRFMALLLTLALLMGVLPAQAVTRAGEVTDLAAYWLCAGQVSLQWSPVPHDAGTEVLYQVYRQTGASAAFEKVGEARTAPAFTDKTVPGSAAETKYKLGVKIGAAAEVLSGPVDVKLMPTGLVDDNDPSVRYSSGWGTWPGKNEGNYRDTVHFIQEPKGTETATLTFVGTGVEVLVASWSFHGKINITVDGKNYGTKDCYSATNQRQNTVFTVSDLPLGVHTITVQPTATKSASATGTKVELDAFKVLNTARTETIVEDANGATKNPAITWNGAWSVYIGDPVGTHHGNNKTENTKLGDSFSYTFTGTGIEVYAHRNTTFSSLDITLDGKDMGNYSLSTTVAGGNEPQALLASFQNLTAGEHTLTATTAARAGVNPKSNLDYLKVTNDNVTPEDPNRKIRIACVGDSITAGDQSSNKSTKSYPAQLQAMLGTENYEVRNYGISGYTLFEASWCPKYLSTNESKALTAWQPDVVIIMLGSNDSQDRSWEQGFSKYDLTYGPGKNRFEADAEEIVRVYQNLASSPTVIMATSPTASERTDYPPKQSVIARQIVPMQKRVADKMGCPLIDIHTLTADFEAKGYLAQFKPGSTTELDLLHPNDTGYAVLAGFMRERLSELMDISVPAQKQLDDRSSRVIYSGTWGDWSDGALFGGTEKYTETVGSAATLVFYGTGVQINGIRSYAVSLMDVTLDGQKIQTSDTYIPSGLQKQVPLFAIDGLDMGMHTLKLELNPSTIHGKTKLSLDSFFIYQEPQNFVNSIQILTETGSYTMEKPGTLQLSAQISPSNAANKNVSWSVSPASAGSITADGLLTVRAESGSLTVTATAQDATLRSVSQVITVGNLRNKTFVDDRALTYTGTWEDRADTGAYSSTAKVTHAANATTSYTFTGTGVQVIGQVYPYNPPINNERFSYAEVTIDGKPAGLATFVHNKDDVRLIQKEVVFEANNLAAGQHTITLKAMNNKDGGLSTGLCGVSVDGLMVYNTATAINYAELDAALLDARIASANAADNGYAESAVTTLRAAIAAAEADASTTQAGVTTAANTLKAAVTAFAASKSTATYTVTLGAAANGTATLTLADGKALPAAVTAGTALKLTVTPAAKYQLGKTAFGGLRTALSAKQDGSAEVLFTAAGNMTVTPGIEGKKIKIACVGDSISYGACSTNPQIYGYPAQLQAMLGDGYDVRNFAMPSACMRADGGFPYGAQSVAIQSKNFQPDIVIIMLGTNDAVAANWADAATFKRDAKAMVAEYQGLASKPTVFVATAPYTTSGRLAAIRDQVNPAIKAAITESQNVQLIDIFAATDGLSNSYFVDGVHLNDAGYRLLAEMMRDGLGMGDVATAEDKAPLQASYDLYATTQRSDCPSTSDANWNTFVAQRTKAKDLLDNANAGKSAVITTTASLREATTKLVFPAPIKVACVGDSITFGHKSGAPGNQSPYNYPAQLQKYLGGRFAVTNYGVSGRTVNSTVGYAYTKTSAYTNSLAANPDIVIIMLGTNDSKNNNWVSEASFKTDATAIISSYQKLSSNPRIFLATSPAVDPDMKGTVDSEGEIIRNNRIKDNIAPLQRTMADELGCTLIDVNANTNALADAGKLYDYLSTDMIHPSDPGYTLLTDYMFGALTQNDLIYFATEPQDLEALEQGTEGFLTATATTLGNAAISYQWYSNTTNSNVGGTPISGVIAATYMLPLDLIPGTYYYYCVASAPSYGTATSRAAAVTVVARGDNRHSVVLTQGDHYTIAAANGSTSGVVTTGDSYTFSVTLADGYTKSQPVVKANGVTLSGAKDGAKYTYTIENIQADQTVTVAGITLNTYTVTYMANGRTVATKTAPHGGSVTDVPAVPARTGYEGTWDRNALNVTGDLIVTAVYTALGGTPLRLWYTKPSSAMPNASNEKETWQQYTLPIGNGDMGANVYGEIATERLSLNEKTLWDGGPSTSRPNYMGGNLVSKGQYGVTQKKIAQLFLEGKSAEASSLCGTLVGLGGEYGGDYKNGYGAYLPWGELKIQYTDITNATAATNYTRDLDLGTALAGVSFAVGDTTYTREYLMSHPDNVLAAKLTATGSKKLNLTLTLPSSVGGTTVALGNDTLKLVGQLTDNQMKYASYLKAVPVGGTVTGNGNALTVAGADEVYLYFSAATDYKNDYPVYRTGETAAALETRVLADVTAAAAKGYASVKADHMADYKSLYNRMSLDLGQTTSTKTTDALLIAYNNGTASASERRLLEVMLFQYGRYLTIGSSREDSQLPSNLQGVWNNQLQAAWHSDYHMNVNLQMNYWPTYSTNLSECGDPLVRYVDSLREPGRVTANIYAGVESTPENPENGFMAHTQNTPFGWTSPGWSFSWGWSPAAVPWILQNCWDYYDFTRDIDYLKNNIYPMMKEEAKLYDQMLVRDNDGKLVSAPAYSPEHGPSTLGNTYEQTLIWQLYEDVITAAELLNTDADLVTRWKANQADLKGPIEIGDSGQIKEWYEETTLNSVPGADAYGHRHLSHMLGLFPGDLVQQREDWVEAARYSMANRTDESTGWGMGQRINTWARLDDGNHAYKLITDLFKKGIYANLWDTHAPFQIDGNFGMTSGVAEMLLQSNMGYIDLLPALPDAWPTGSFDGLLARGNFEISASWSEGHADRIDILSKIGGDASVSYPNLSLAEVKDENGNYVNCVSVSKDQITFPTEAGKTYTITQIPAKAATSTVENLKAYRLTGSEIELSWTAKAETQYRVYRQIDGGEWVSVSAVLTTGAFKDTKAMESLGTKFTYAIAEIVEGQELAPAPGVEAKDLRNMAGLIDDRDSRITYTSGWGKWDGKEGNYRDSVTFAESPTPTSGLSFSMLFLGTGIEILAVKNTDHGEFAISIDGKAYPNADCYATSNLKQQLVFSVTDLPFGVHTITVAAAGTKNAQATRTKVEFDAFRVLDNTAKLPTGVTVSPAGGVTLLNKVGSTLQMIADITPADAMNKAIVWSITKVDGSAASSTINQSGLLTAGAVSEIVRVKATSAQVPGVTGYKDITIAPPEYTELIVEDRLGTSGTTKNSAITWTGSWYVWQEGGPHGGSKCETVGAGDSFTYKFTGSTIEIYGQKQPNFSSLKIVLDGKEMGTYSQSGNTEHQVLMARYENLDPTMEHTLVATEVGIGNNHKVALDYIRVLQPKGAAGTDKAALLTAIQTNQNKVESGYTPATWAPFKLAFDAAVALMNKADATQSEINAAVTALSTAAGALVEATITAPDTTGATISVLAAGGTTANLSWSAVAGATKYNLYSDSARTQLVGSTDKTTYILTKLTSGRSYTYYLEAENAGGKAAFPAPVTFTTVDILAPGAVTALAYNGETGIVTWAAATDNVGVTGYKVYVDNVLKATVTQTSYTVAPKLDLNESHVIKVIAADAAKNESAPASIKVGTDIVTYAVTFLASGEILEIIRVPAGATLARSEFPTVPQKPGYVGVWNAADGDLLVTKDETITAVYTAQTDTVTLDPNGGEALSSNTIEVTFGQPYGTLPTPIHTDTTKTFDGWYTEAVAGDKVSADTLVAIKGAHTLYAHWRTSEVSATPDTTVTATPSLTVTLPYTGAGIVLTVAEQSTYTYQWQRNTGSAWEDLTNETTHTYTIPAGDVVHANNGWKYRCSITNAEPGKLPTAADGGAGVTLVITKGVPAAPAGLVGHMPTAAGTADGYITGLVQGKTYEYKLRGAANTLLFRSAASEYAPLTTATKLASGVYLVRLAETPDYQASPDAEVIIPIYQPDTIAVTGVELNLRSATLYSNRAGSVTLVATVTPANATNRNVLFSSSDSAVAAVAANGVVTAVSNGTAVITATTEDGGYTATCTITVTTYTDPVTPPTSWDDEDRGTTVKNEDGSTTTTVVDKKTGTVTETTVTLTGDKTVVVTKTDGSSITTSKTKSGITSTTTVDTSGKTSAVVTLPEAVVSNAKQGETIALPMPKLPVSGSNGAAATVAVSAPVGTPVKVEIPVANVKPGMVAVLVNADGTETLVKFTGMTEKGLTVTLYGEATIKVVDNSKLFTDVASDNWAADSIQFVAGREIFTGTGENSFSPMGEMTRGMLVTVLARLDGQSTAGGDTWYSKGAQWAKEQGISDGSGMESAISREQLAVMLYRYTKAGKVETDLTAFTDASTVSDWAQDAMQWAVKSGIINGKAGALDPKGNATRAEVAAMLERFIGQAVK